MASHLRYIQLLNLLRHSSGTVVSGEELSSQLAVSRTAIWKQVNALRLAGWQIDAIPSQGYRLVSEPDQLDAELIRSGLPQDSLIGCRIISLAETGSTNADLYSLADQGAEEGLVVLADRQTGGKGRMGRKWASPGGVNLYCSVLLRPAIPPYEAPQLTFLSALAVARAVSKTTGLQAAIKWPNDLLLNGNKVAGLLNEMNAETDLVSFVVLGIGINLNMRQEQFPLDLRHPASSLLIEGGVKISRQDFTTLLLMELNLEYKRFLQHGFEPARTEWARYCNAAGRKVRVDGGAASISGEFAGLDQDGALLVRLAGGGLERILSGDVQVF